MCYQLLVLMLNFLSKEILEIEQSCFSVPLKEVKTNIYHCLLLKVFLNDYNEYTTKTKKKKKKQ